MAKEIILPPSEITYRDGNLFVLMRLLEERDAEVIHTAAMLSLKNFLPFMDWVHRDLSIESQVHRIRNSKKNYLEGIEFDFSVFDQNTEEFLMSATLSKSKSPNKNALSIGYWTSIKHCNKGFATLITKILTILAFDYMGCDRVEIACNKANKKSIRVIEKCGFIFEGQARNYFVEPSNDMIQNGYYPDRTCLQYALILQDLKSLSWYEKIKSKLTIKY